MVHYVAEPGWERMLHHLCAGIEEEGVHVRTLERHGGEPVRLAHEAAESSQLFVGIGACAGRLCLHLAALPLASPLLEVADGFGDREAQRRLGHNAARLVKVLPFKDSAIEGGAVSWPPGEARPRGPLATWRPPPKGTATR